MARSEAEHKRIVAEAAARWKVPAWLLWGTAGAESTWGEGGTNLFGLLAAAEGANISDWRSAANQAAKTYAGLIKAYGSVAAAVPHYSGNSYTISHVEALARERGGFQLPSGPFSAGQGRRRRPEKTSPPSVGSPLMRFLITGALVLGGAGLVGIGLSRAVGSSAAGSAREAAAKASQLQGAGA